MLKQAYFFRLIAILAVTPLIAACSPSFMVVEHPQPKLSVNSEGFSNVDCPPNQYGFRMCSPQSPLASFGCDEIKDVESLFGGLTPHYQMVYCFIEPYIRPYDGQALQKFKTDKQFVYQDGCLNPRFVRYSIVKDGEFQIINTQDALRQTFAPIESDDEALSYALAFTGLRAQYEFQLRWDFRFFGNKIEETYIEKIQDGYLVHLFNYHGCGCGPHTMASVIVHVKFDGSIEQQKEQPLYEDPALDNYCTD